MAQPNSATTSDIALLVGTRKGGFVLSSNADRKSGRCRKSNPVAAMSITWCMTGAMAAPFIPLVNYTIWGAEIHISRDLGSTWTTAETPPRFADREGKTLNKFGTSSRVGRSSRMCCTRVLTRRRCSEAMTAG